MTRDNTARDEPWKGGPIEVGESKASRMAKALEESGCSPLKGLSYGVTANLVFLYHGSAKERKSVYCVGSCEKITLENFALEILSKRLGLRLFRSEGDKLVETDAYSKIREILES